MYTKTIAKWSTTNTNGNKNKSKNNDRQMGEKQAYLRTTSVILPKSLMAVYNQIQQEEIDEQDNLEEEEDEENLEEEEEEQGNYMEFEGEGD